MRTDAFLILAVVSLAGCNSGGQWKPPPPLPPEHNAPYTLTAGDTQLIQTTISDKMKDPNSTQFRKVQAVTRKDGTVLVCGEVNAKNSFGGYNGFAPFVGELATGKFSLNIVPAQYADIQAVAFDQCRLAGMELRP